MLEICKRRLVPYEMVSPGYEAVYTGERSETPTAPEGWPAVRYTDEQGQVIERWSVWTWRSELADEDPDIRLINAMQAQLGPLDEDTRQIRAHIGSLQVCEPGIPVTVDDLLMAIGRGRFLEPPLHNGCWCGSMWWQSRGTQHGQQEAMAAIEQILLGYLEGQPWAALAERYPDATGFIRRAGTWLPPAGELSPLQRLMFRRMLLPFEFLSGRNRDHAAVDRDCFGEGGRGPQLDAEIAALADLPFIYPEYKREFREALQAIHDPPQQELYRICGALAHGLHGLSDCHHSAFRWLERWVHDIGALSVGIPGRNTGAERHRLAELMFGYTLGLDSWLLGRSMQFLLLDLAYVDLGGDPKDEILRVYTYLGAPRNPIKDWLAACLWKALSLTANPRGLVVQQELNERAAQQGISTRAWIEGRETRRPTGIPGLAQTGVTVV